MARDSSKGAVTPPPAAGAGDAALIKELVAHLHDNRTELREEWARRISDTDLLTAASGSRWATSRAWCCDLG